MRLRRWCAHTPLHVNTSRSRSSTSNVKAVNGQSLRRTAALLVLVLLAGAATTLRLRPRMPGQVHHRLRLNRLVLLSETVNEARVPIGISIRRAGFLTAPVVVGALLVLLRRRRTAFVPVPVRRRKLPAGNTKSPDPSD